MICILSILEREKLATEQIEYLGEQLVKFVTIGGVTNFKESLKDVLNLSPGFEIHDSHSLANHYTACVM